MPLFYTHSKDDNGGQRDDTGRRFETDEDAIAEAVKRAAAILALELSRGLKQVTITLYVEHADRTSAGVIHLEGRIERPRR